jgi:hypothetical protein
VDSSAERICWTELCAPNLTRLSFNSKAFAVTRGFVDLLASCPRLVSLRVPLFQTCDPATAPVVPGTMVLFGLPLTLTECHLYSNGLEMSPPGLLHLSHMPLVKLSFEGIVLVGDPHELDGVVFPKLTNFVCGDWMWNQPATVAQTMLRLLGGCMPALVDLEYHGSMASFPASGLHLTRLVLGVYGASEHAAKFPRSLAELHLEHLGNFPNWRHGAQTEFLRPFRHLSSCSKLILGLSEPVVIDLRPKPTVD